MIYRPTDAQVGTRLDSFIAEVSELSRSAAAKAIENGTIRVNGEVPQKKYAVKAEDEIEIAEVEPEIYDVLPENIPLDIVYEDSDLLVVNKPKGMVVHPAHGNLTGTLVHAILYHIK